MFPIVEAGSPALEGTSLPAFVVARDGLYLRKRSLLGLSQTKVDRVAHLPRGKAISRLPAPEAPSGARWARSSGSSERFMSASKPRRSSCSCGGTITSSCWCPRNRRRRSRSGTSSIARACRPGPDSSARSTRTAPSRRLRVRPTKTTRRTSTDSTSSSAISSGDGHRSRRRSSSTAIASASARARCSSGPGAIVPPPDEWLARVKVAPAPRRKSWPKAPSAHAAARQDRASGQSPDRRRLDELLDAAASLAEKLGYRLRTDLVPTYGTTEGAADA